MANKQTVGELVYKISGDMDNLKAELKKSETAVKDLDKSVKSADGTVGGFAGGLKKLAVAAGLAFVAKLAVDFGKAALQAYANAQQSAIQFNNAQMNVAGTTKDQIEDMNRYVEALEKKTTVDDKSIRQGAQILAQDQITIENQKKILGGIVDIAVANAKSNGGEIDVSGTAKAVGRAVVTGDAGILTRQNVIIDPKTAKALKDTGDQAERAAILMKVLEENGKGAGEALGNSFQGSINRAKDTVEDLQVAVGKGLSVALTVLTNGLSDTVSGFSIASDGTNKFGTAMVYVAGLINFVINTLKLMGISLLQTGNGLFQLAKVSFNFGKDVIGIFKNVGDAIGSIGEAMVNVLSGDFKEAKDALKKGFDFSGTFDNSKRALDEATEASGKLQEQFNKTTKDLGNNIETMANAGAVYKEAAAQQDALTAAKDSTAKAQAKETALTEAQEEALKKLGDQSDSYKDKFISIIDSIKEQVKSLTEEVNKSLKTFNDEVKESFTGTNEELVGIFVDAKDRVKEINEELRNSKPEDDNSALRKELGEQEKILKSRQGFEERQAETIKQIKDKLAQAGIDAEKEGLDSLTNITSLKDQIKREEALRELDEFARAEELQRQKLVLLTDTLIAEVTALREKITQQETLEAELSLFLKTQLTLRKADVDAFAKNAIAKYGEMANALRTSISLQERLNSLRTNPTGGAKPQFASGGFVGSAGGEVHPGEYVIPAHMVRAMSGLVAGLENSRTSGSTTSINAPVTVNASLSDRLDAGSVGREIAWELERM